MKAYLINPPAAKGVPIVREGRCMQRKGAWTAVWPPISLAYIAAVLEKEGIECKLSDCIVEEIGFAKLRKTIESFKPELVIINTATPSIESDLMVAKLAKEVNPKIITAAFGIHVSALPEEALKLQPGLDIVIRNEPEMTAKEIGMQIKSKKINLKKIKGTSYKKNNKIIHNKNRELISNLDELPFPAWHLVKQDCYKIPFTNNNFLMLATCRGCPFNCLYCSAGEYYGKRHRMRDPKKIVDEMEWAKKSFGTKDFLFWSESFTINNQFTNEVCDEILKRNAKFRWICNSRTDNVDFPTLKKMRKAGCWMIGFGVESGDQGILNKMRKGITLQQSADAVRMSRKAGLEVVGHFVLGMPGETEKSARKTIEFAKKLNLDYAQFYCAVPFPGSELYELAKKKNWIKSKDWAMFEQNFSIMDTDTMSSAKVMKLRNKAYRNFFFRPRIVWNNLAKLKNPATFKNAFGMLKEFIDWI